MRSRLPFLSVSDCPGGDQPSPYVGDRAASESLQMYSDSRKAQLNSFAHHRATLLFSTHLARGVRQNWAATVHEGTEHAPPALDLKQRVIAGIRGFVPAARA